MPSSTMKAGNKGVGTLTRHLYKVGMGKTVIETLSVLYVTKH
jgi:hypothetical protein